MADLTQLKADVDFMKSLAVDGSRVPFNGGWPLLLAGAIFGGAALIHYFIQVAGAGPDSLTLWGGAMLLYAVCCLGWGLKSRASFRAQGSKNRVAATAWSGIGFSIFLLSVVQAIVSLRMQAPFPGAFMMPMVLVLYGLGWLITAEASSQRWMSWVGIGCFVMTPLMAWLSFRPEQLLIYAAALVCSALIPGWILLVQARASQ